MAKYKKTTPNRRLARLPLSEASLLASNGRRKYNLQERLNGQKIRVQDWLNKD